MLPQTIIQGIKESSGHVYWHVKSYRIPYASLWNSTTVTTLVLGLYNTTVRRKNLGTFGNFTLQNSVFERKLCSTLTGLLCKGAGRLIEFSEFQRGNGALMSVLDYHAHHGSAWLSLAQPGSAWLSLDQHCSALLCLAQHSSAGLSQHGSVRLNAALRGSTKLRGAQRGSAWGSLVHLGLTLHCSLALHCI